MRALVWEAPEVMALRETDPPEPAVDEAVIKVAYAGICGSELGGYLGHNALRRPPLVMGHEFSGTVTAIGADVEGLEIGDRVTCNPLLACGACVLCREGLPQLCLRRALVGAHRPGAFAERVSVPAAAVHRLPDGLSLRDGAMVEPAAVALRAARLAGDVRRRALFVIGAGPIGLLVLQFLRHAGAGSVLLTDLDPERLAMAEALGATPVSGDALAAVREATHGVGAAVSVDAVGSAETRALAVAATRPAGLVLLSGLHAEASHFPASDVIRREITVRGAFCYDSGDFADAMQALAQGEVRLDPWVREAPLGEGGAWFDRLIRRPGDVAKVLLVPG